MNRKGIWDDIDLPKENISQTIIYMNVHMQNIIDLVSVLTYTYQCGFRLVIAKGDVREIFVISINKFELQEFVKRVGADYIRTIKLDKMAKMTDNL